MNASGELLKTQDASVGEVVDQRSVDSLPLNGRMLIDLVLTVPGAHISHGAGTEDMNPLYWRPGQRSAVSIGGSRPNGNYFLLDGFEARAEFFNALNRTNLGTPNRFVNTSNFGSITEVSSPGREIQLSARISF